MIHVYIRLYYTRKFSNIPYKFKLVYVIYCFNCDLKYTRMNEYVFCYRIPGIYVKLFGFDFQDIKIIESEDAGNIKA